MKNYFLIVFDILNNHCESTGFSPCRLLIDIKTHDTIYLWSELHTPSIHFWKKKN